jgi:protein-L-isoaspartate O-methyltransferase
MLDFVEYRKKFLEATKDWDNEKWNNFEDNPFVVLAPMLQDGHIKNCRFLESRLKMLEYLPKNSVVAEVGTQYGYFAEQIMAIAKPKKLHLLDYSFDLFKAEISKKQKSLVQEGIENGTVELHEGDSSTNLRSFPDEYFDWIYIDADHAYQGVCKDIQQGYTKVKAEGMMVFNDYTNWSVCEVMPYGVAKAVNEFCIANNWEMVFFAFHCLGYHDVAIRKNTGETAMRIPLEEANSELQNYQDQIQQLQLQLEQAKKTIDLMENDQFGKLRSIWRKIQQNF